MVDDDGAIGAVQALARLLLIACFVVIFGLPLAQLVELEAGNVVNLEAEQAAREAVRRRRRYNHGVLLAFELLRLELLQLLLVPLGFASLHMISRSFLSLLLFTTSLSCSMVRIVGSCVCWSN